MKLILQIPSFTWPRDAILYCRGVNAAGIEHFIISMPGDYELAPIELMRKEIIFAVAER